MPVFSVGVVMTGSNRPVATVGIDTDTLTVSLQRLNDTKNGSSPPAAHKEPAAGEALKGGSLKSLANGLRQVVSSCLNWSPLHVRAGVYGRQPSCRNHELTSLILPRSIRHKLSRKSVERQQQLETDQDHAWTLLLQSAPLSSVSISVTLHSAHRLNVYNIIYGLCGHDNFSKPFKPDLLTIQDSLHLMAHSGAFFWILTKEHRAHKQIVLEALLMPQNS